MEAIYGSVGAKIMSFECTAFVDRDFLFINKNDVEGTENGSETYHISAHMAK